MAETKTTAQLFSAPAASSAPVVEFPQTTGLGFSTTYTLPNSRTWNNLKSYPYLDFNYDVKVTGVPDRVLRTIRVKSSQIQDTSRWRFEYGSAIVDFEPGVMTGGDFAFTGQVIDDITLEIVGVTQ